MKRTSKFLFERRKSRIMLARTISALMPSMTASRFFSVLIPPSLRGAYPKLFYRVGPANLTREDSYISNRLFAVFIPPYLSAISRKRLYRTFILNGLLNSVVPYRCRCQALALRRKIMPITTRSPKSLANTCRIERVPTTYDRFPSGRSRGFYVE